MTTTHPTSAPTLQPARPETTRAVQPPDPPGPGSWVLDPSHVPTPISGFFADAMPEGYVRGWRECLPRYGTLLEEVTPFFVDGFVYLQNRPVGAPPDAAGPPPREVWDAVVSQLPVVQERFAAAERALTGRIWRADLARWDSEIKPARLARQRALRAVDPRTLDDDALARHIDACRTALVEGVYQHHRHNMAAILPVALFLLTASGTTGRSTGELLELFRGSSPVSQGFPDEREQLRAALAADPSASAAVRDDGADPAAVLDRLRAAPGPVGRAASQYLDLVLETNVDSEDSVGAPGGSEAPELVLAAIRAAVEGRRAPALDTAGREAEIRASVPPEHRAAFDEALAEARLVYRLRDERAVYGDKLVGPIARRALLEAGRRLVARGRVAEPENAVDATAAEIGMLLLDGAGPSARELAARTDWRRTATYRQMPPFLGPPPAPPVPAEWLPPAAATVHAAMGLAVNAILEQPEARTTATSVQGLPVSRGTYEGRAVVVHDADDLRRVQPGDVLVATHTGPAFNLVLPLVGAIVTDRGGLLSHAAIVAREFGVPAVVGCSDATQVIRDGDRVRVDGETGVVSVR
ncbi:PEP-utilizing enzyme [Blastococcus deserti]|uniref:PEP-utilizing enzyme n=1 Tax=Blastococcus deserti TaxID=2259033 RepID=A0ABW4X7Q7_9ACTN